ncbi:hypothetical protein EMIT051CA3_40166 [Pseudomonas chlororaphis]
MARVAALCATLRGDSYRGNDDDDLQRLADRRAGAPSVFPPRLPGRQLRRDGHAGRWPADEPVFPAGDPRLPAWRLGLVRRAGVLPGVRAAGLAGFPPAPLSGLCPVHPPDRPVPDEHPALPARAQGAASGCAQTPAFAATGSRPEAGALTAGYILSPHLCATLRTPKHAPLAFGAVLPTAVGESAGTGALA